MSGRIFLICGAILGGLAVAAGAFGAHALKERFSPDQLATFEIGVRYQMYHALALVGLGIWMGRQASTAGTVAGVCFLFGIVVFSGLLYALVFSGLSMLGRIVPIGGTALIIGWIAWAVAAWGAPQAGIAD